MTKILLFQGNFFENYTTPKLNINLNLKSSSGSSSVLFFLKNSLKFAKEVQISIVKKNQKTDFPRKFSRLLLIDPEKKNLRFN